LNKNCLYICVTKANEMKNTYQFIVTKLDGEIEVIEKDCKLPLNTSLYSQLLRIWNKNEIIKFQIKDKYSNLFIRE